MPDTIEETKQALKEARKELKAARKEAEMLRYKFLDELIANLDDPKVVERIKKAEELRLSYLKIKHVLKPSNASLMTQLEVPTDDSPPKQATSWKRIVDPSIVTDRIFERNTNTLDRLTAPHSPFLHCPKTLIGLPPPQAIEAL